jgi:drug/metabolite transporter (DMT)-like permease
MQLIGGALVLAAVILANHTPKINTIPEMAH